ncbi:hypothetical protein [Providencia huashanensis]|uniref:hypothetical protein n=1 Tax=Providencia huashanensis TaxID=3037798 RepID=UPI002B0031FA|nr:hypothetical protein [Providencia sp. 23021821]
MKERGIIFNSEMVRAILDGRKTQTRRVINPQPELTQKSGFKWKGGLFGAGCDDRETNRNFAHKKCPLGKVGDRLWVRETWQGPLINYTDNEPQFKGHHIFEKSDNCVYKADGLAAPEFIDSDDNLKQGWRPSSNMPRWASRITLEITDVRVEHLQDISKQDAVSEGAPQGHHSIDVISKRFGFSDFSRSWFAQIWMDIYGEDDWAANPWVWVIEFKRV